MLAASTDILLDMVSKLDSPDVALVHQMPFTTDHPGFAHAVEKVCFRGKTFVKPCYCRETARCCYKFRSTQECRQLFVRYLLMEELTFVLLIIPIVFIASMCLLYG